MSDFDHPHHDGAGHAPSIHVDCHTCLAVNTTACGDCLVTHLLANDAGPIEFVSTGLRIVDGSAGDRGVGAVPDDVEADSDVVRAIALLDRVGLLDDPPAWVARSEFESDLAAVAR
ncbi:MAG: hypothetical protein AAFP84_07730 [Actinomycetota bacterium]